MGYIEKDTNFVSTPYTKNFKPLDRTYITKKASLVENFYNKYFANSGYSGSFLVAKNGYILYENYEGYSSFEKKEKIDATSSLHIASISKVITSVAILKLVDENKINLDDKVTQYLPSFPYQKTTIRTLLNHRSGLPNYARFEVLLGKKWNRKNILTNEGVLQLLSKHKFPLVFKHDSHFSYCNTNYVMLALIIEKVTNSKYEEALKKMIFEPLSMENSFVFKYPTDKDKVSQSYKSNYLNYGWDQYDALYGDKNIYSTPRDLLKLDLALYSDEFLSKSLKELAFKGYSYEKKGVKNYGLGIRLREWETGEKIHYHNGWWHGNTSSYVSLKKDTITIIALSNKYSKKPYQIMKISGLMGEYPIEIDKELIE